MNNFSSFILLLFFVMITSLGFTQEDINMEKLSQLPFLTEDQKAMLRTERSKLKESRDAFRKSLNSEQIAILKNSSLSNSQKKLKLSASFSQQQKTLLKLSENRTKAMTNRLKASLSDRQKKEFKLLKSRMNKMKTGDSRGTRLKQNQLQNRSKNKGGKPKGNG
ncbi:MAG: hypothetical protein CMC63_09950 [Flavobacteriaceae bacterium]|nr:hypothetical protein [Flavobacteriaceae bacterium]